MNVLIRATAVVVVLAVAVVSRGHETDNYSLPAGREFADMGPALNVWAYGLIERAVERTNGEIKRAIAENRTDELAELHSGAYLARRVNGQMPWAMEMIEGFERSLATEETRRRYPGRVTVYKPGPTSNIYSFANILDLRAFIRIFFSGTFKAYGVYLGTDKVGHFTDMGMNYWREYNKAREAGGSEEDGVQKALDLGLKNPFLSESGLLGFVTAGSYSNADLVANYCGLMFYRNLYEPVMLKGEKRPPMVVREGQYWKISGHVRRDSDFFAWFISEHWDETLNPSLYDPTLRNGIRKRIEERCGKVLMRHADIHGNIRPPEYFEQKVRELSKYWGQEYGHNGSREQLIVLADFFKDGHAMGTTRGHEPALHIAAAAGDAAAVQTMLGKADVEAVSPLGATALHRAIQHPTIAAALLAKGASADTTDAHGRTPLHWAALDREAKVVGLLIEKGADVNVGDNDGRAPLHLAAEGGNAGAAETLLRKGARVDARDRFGATVLHVAAGKDLDVVQLLLANRAPVNAKDDFGYTPLHEAARAGKDACAGALIQAGASIASVDDYNSTPLHLASRYSHVTLARMLVERGADVNARNRTGAAPLHEAALAGDAGIVKLLLGRHAQADVRNAKGQTPVDIASAKGRKDVEEALGSRPRAPSVAAGG